MTSANSIAVVAVAVLAVAGAAVAVLRFLMASVEPETAMLLTVILLLGAVIVVGDRLAGDDRGAYAR